VAQVAARLGIRPVEIRRVSTRLPQKDIVDEDRQKGVQRRIANQEGSMRVDDDVSGVGVVAIDDLYGSGASMREAARALRDAGAKEVVGLTVTKQRLYEGVRLATLD
jgi:predicted amidophosphoribosyltransferase